MNGVFSAFHLSHYCSLVLYPLSSVIILLILYKIKNKREKKVRMAKPTIIIFEYNKKGSYLLEDFFYIISLYYGYGTMDDNLNELWLSLFVPFLFALH